SVEGACGMHPADLRLDPEERRAAIERVRSEEFRSVLPTVESPYGDGTAGERIAELLAGVELGDRLLDKRVLSIDP
ncbi:MAG: hypothetical protein ACO4CW_09990, partial [Planctomycetota bacterium]